MSGGGAGRGRERKNEREREREREREKILSRCHTQCGAHHRARSHNPGIRTWAEIKSQTFNQLSHSGAPWHAHLMIPFIWSSRQNKSKVKKNQKLLWQKITKKDYMWDFWEKRNILYPDKGIGYTGISICQNCTGIRQYFLRYDIKSTSKTRKRDKLDFIKTKDFCASKYTIKWKNNSKKRRK